jgi:hypothetical protein
LENTEGKMDFSAQTFLKDGDQYHFLYKKDTVFSFSNKEVSEFMVKNIPAIYSIFIKKSYEIKPTEKSVSFDDLRDYETFAKSNYEVFKGNQLKDGIYLDHQSFSIRFRSREITFLKEMIKVRSRKPLKKKTVKRTGFLLLKCLLMLKMEKRIKRQCPAL